eukprot:9987408-Prorocentrum_lima.AAC.1
MTSSLVGSEMCIRDSIKALRATKSQGEGGYGGGLVLASGVQGRAWQTGCRGGGWAGGWVGGRAGEGSESQKGPTAL